MPSASVPACTKPTSRPALSTSAKVEPANVVLSLARIGLTCKEVSLISAAKVSGQSLQQSGQADQQREGVG